MSGDSARGAPKTQRDPDLIPARGILFDPLIVSTGPFKMSDVRKNVSRPETPPPPAQRFTSPRMDPEGSPVLVMRAVEDGIATAKRQNNQAMEKFGGAIWHMLKELRTVSKDLQLIRNRLESIESRLPSKSRQGY